MDRSLLDVVLHLSRTSAEFDVTMRRLFPDFKVIPVQALDTPQVRPRIKLTLPPVPSESEPTVLVIDAFDPPQQIRFAQECQRLKEQHPDWKLKRIGQELGIGKKVVSEALKYAQLMTDVGTTDLYLELQERPAQASRWRARTSAETNLAPDSQSPQGPRDGIADTLSSTS